MPKKLLILALVIVLAIVGYLVYRNSPGLISDKQIERVETIGSGPTRIVYAAHWLEDQQTNGIWDGEVLKSKGLKQYLEEYIKLNPEISFELRLIPYGEYADKLRALHTADLVPDIYQIYSQWGVTYAPLDMLDTPPADIVEDVKKNYFTTKGATIDGKIWGIPTEINDYALLYNKEIFKEEGIQAPPKTWGELANIAVRLAKKDSNGNFTRYGIGFLKDNDWQVVDPYLSLVFSNGGSFLNANNTKSLINSPAGVEALDAQVVLFKRGATDINANFFDFKSGKVAMVIAPPWVKAGFASKEDGFGDRFEEVVGVSAFPYMKKPASLQYSWFMGVMNRSKQKTAAWDFLRWFTSEIQPGTSTTRYGDLLADTIGAIPSRKIDVDNHPSLEDFYTKVYVDNLPLSVSEPNVLESARIKNILMTEIQSAWVGSKTSREALNDASAEIDNLLDSLY